MPAATPVTTPEPLPTVATAALLVVQDPPVEAELSVVVDPAHTEDTPLMLSGKGLTVTCAIRLHPFDVE